jgi:hypothetical protein
MKEAKGANFSKALRLVFKSTRATSVEMQGTRFLMRPATEFLLKSGPSQTLAAI